MATIHPFNCTEFISVRATEGVVCCTMDQRITDCLNDSEGGTMLYSDLLNEIGVRRQWVPRTQRASHRCRDAAYACIIWLAICRAALDRALYRLEEDGVLEYYENTDGDNCVGLLPCVADVVELIEERGEDASVGKGELGSLLADRFALYS
jgi:hypothetical protein